MSPPFKITALFAALAFLGTGCATAGPQAFVYEPFVPEGKPFPKGVERPDLALPLPPGAIDRSPAGNPKNTRQLFVDPAFIKQALDTPSPEPWVWERFYEFFSWSEDDVEQEFWKVFREHLRRGGPPNEKELAAFIDHVKKNMVFVEGGSFWFGDWGAREGQPGPVTGDDNNKPPQYVTVSSFSIYRTQVTYGDYDVYSRARNGKFMGEGESYEIKFRFPNYPILSARWDEAKGYCQWLAKLTGEPFDLPTETQWEYAARDGGKEVYFAGPFPFGDTPMRDHLENHGRRLSASELTSRPVGSYGTGLLGIADMVGYEREWVNDWYAPDIFGRDHAVDPRGPVSGSERVVRFGSSGMFETAVSRRGEDPDEEFIGFRCALNRLSPWR
ncbi:formylglycine-generating enzyme family protein [Denitromonas iodatirespirans]|uniref:SUMF1/EgtB/PvdO family nonheme iron enzyme n=1 Tax=Denitromonas iodatirespirans TaxID=2795389 RepID=A0A944DGN0_DENI1|nr:SUMF1/EgtB/PvdO family nonheme iron enzyme [Denitromonas iodatirespirans]MBT0963842.1 SUMF1/EgtB/PvdO family nonheme iron enzyme [Denitromonas iodatirespirans]